MSCAYTFFSLFCLQAITLKFRFTLLLSLSDHDLFLDLDQMKLIEEQFIHSVLNLLPSRTKGSK